MQENKFHTGLPYEAGFFYEEKELKTHKNHCKEVIDHE